MRLLNVRTYEVQTFLDRAARPKYAILSHRWYSQEVTFNTLNSSELRDESLQTPALEKIRWTCHVAREDGLDWVWIDSCNINKESSQELSESILSMFRWYREATECYTYMYDVVASEKDESAFKRHGSDKSSEWFERGWTLQELLAPRTMRFFDKNWRLIGTRNQLAPEIAKITGIEARFLDGSIAFQSASIATKMSWMANRKTTKEEDMAYSLLGVFDVAIVPNYGVGRGAFMELQQKLVQTYRDESIFAWAVPKGGLPRHSRNWGVEQWGLLAPWIDCFQGFGDVVITGKPFDRPVGAIAPVAEGVKFPIPLSELQPCENWTYNVTYLLTCMWGVFFCWLPIIAYRFKERQEFTLTLNCWRKNTAGKLKPVQIFICRDSAGDQFWRRCRCSHVGLAARMPSKTAHYPAGSYATRDIMDITINQPIGVHWADGL